MDKASRKQEMRDWLNVAIADSIESFGAVDVPVVVDAAVGAFSGRPKFMQELIVEILRPIAYQSARQIIGATRNEGFVELGEEVVARSEFERRAHSRFERWIENIKPGRDVRIMDMTREDCQLASMNRSRRALYEGRLSDLFSKLAEDLQEHQVVGDLFTVEEVEEMYESVESRLEGCLNGSY